MTKRGIWAVLLVLAATPVAAVDGVLEINQACVATGCFSGDAAGFPVQITSPGSYRLTGNLTVTDANTTAIEVTTDEVSLDLNGFAILGPTVCDPAPCTPTGSGRGVAAPNREHIAVSNGTIRGLGSMGVSVGGGSRVEGLRLSHNGARGISAPYSEIVAVHNIVTFNGDTGILCRGIVAENVISENLNVGLSIANAVVRDNVVKANASYGIFVDSGLPDEGSTLTGNTIVSNGSQGLQFNTRAGYGGNVLTNNNSGNANPQVGGAEATEIGTNICGTDTVCP